MAIALEESLTGTGDGSSIVLSSWKPSSGDFILVGVALNDVTVTPSLSGNGLTFVEIGNIENVDSAGRVWYFRAQGSSPSSGSITVTLSGNTVCALVIAARFSGVDTSGNNGSGAVEAIETASAKAGGDVDMVDNITTLTNNAWAIAFSHQVTAGLTLPGDDTPINEDVTCSEFPSFLVGSMWYDTESTPSTVTLGQTGSLSASRAWCMISVSLREPQPVDSINFNNYKRRRLNQLVAA